MSPGGAVSATGVLQGGRATHSAEKAALLWHLSTGVFGRTGRGGTASTDWGPHREASGEGLQADKGTPE